MVVLVWVGAGVMSVVLTIWAGLRISRVRKGGADGRPLLGSTMLVSTIRWSALFPILLLAAAACMSTAPLITSAQAQSASIDTFASGILVAESLCCEPSVEVAADTQERVVAGAQSVGLFGVSLVVSALTVVVAERTLMKAFRQNSVYAQFEG